MNAIYSGDVQVVQTVDFLWLLPLFPLLGGLVNGIFGSAIQRRFGVKAIAVVAIGAMVAATAASLIAVFGYLLPLPGEHRYLLDTGWALASIGRVQVSLALALDPLSATLVVVVTAVGTLVHIYSLGVPAAEKSAWRYFSFLNLLCFAMLVLVLADNFLLMLVGWEGVTVCGYLLVGFEYQNAARPRAGMKAFLVNRVGDCGLLGAIALVFWGLAGSVAPGGGLRTEATRTVMVDVPHGGAAIELRTRGDRAPQAALREVKVGATLTFREIRDQLVVKNGLGERPFAEALTGKLLWGLPLMLLVCLGLAMAAAGKSAQFPLAAWLPDAMVGPLPASALIQTATTVAAGIYLLGRLAFLFVLSPGAMAVVATVGAASALLAALVCIFQHDLKRLLAFSSVSQIGFGFLALGVGAPAIGIFHLVTHACFTGCLLLAAGSVIRGHRFLEMGAGGEAEAGSLGEPLRDARIIPSGRDPADLRNLGGVAALMPQTRRAYLLACLAAAGLPIAAGFYSANAVLWSAFRGRLAPIPDGLLWALAFVAAGISSFYIFRSYYLVFHGRPASSAQKQKVREPPRAMTAVVSILALAAIVSGPLLGWPAVWTAAGDGEGGSAGLARFLAPVFSLTIDARPEGALPTDRPLAWALQLVGCLTALLGWLAARVLYRDLRGTDAFLGGLRHRWDRVHRFIYHQYQMDWLYREIGVLPVRDFSRVVAFIDRQLIAGTGRVVSWLSRLIPTRGRRR
jgi:NADH-quinone oxidoreductase subunit L